MESPNHQSRNSYLKQKLHRRDRSEDQAAGPARTALSQQPQRLAGRELSGLAREVGRDNIRVTCVIPGNVQTPRQQRWYTPDGEAEIVASQCLDGRLLPEDVAAMILFLASDDARFVTGHNYWVDAGWS